MEPVEYITESIHPRLPISQVHIHRKSRRHGPPSSFANTRWGREEIAGRHHYLADGTYVRRSKRRRVPAPQAFPSITLQESSSLAHHRETWSSPATDMPPEPASSRLSSRKSRAAHIFSWPVAHPLRSSPTPHNQTFFSEASCASPISNDAEVAAHHVPYQTVIREPPRERTLRHERRPLSDATLNRRSFDNQATNLISGSPSLGKRALSGTGPRSIRTYELTPLGPAITRDPLDQEDIPPHVASPDLRYATAEAIRRTDEQTQIRFSPTPSLPVFGSVGSRSRKRRHHSSSSSSSGAWRTGILSADASSSAFAPSPRASSFTVWLGVLFGRRKTRQQQSLAADAAEAVESIEPGRHASSHHGRRRHRKRRKDSGC